MNRKQRILLGIIGLLLLLAASVTGCSRAYEETPLQALVHGKALLNSMKYAQALPEFRLAERSPRSALEAHYFLGYTLQQMGDLPGAESELLVVAGEDEHFGDVRTRLAKIMVRAELQDAIWGGQWIEHEVAETNDNASADAYYVLGIRDFRLGHAGTAAKYLERAVSLQPGHVEASKALSLVLLIQGDPVRAESVILTLPKSAEGSEALGEFYRLNGNLSKAADAFQEALRQDPASTAARVNLADTLWLAGKPQEAEQLLDALYTARIAPYEHLHALAALSNGHTDQALSELKTLIQGSNPGPDGRSRLIAALVDAHRIPAAAALTDSWRLASPGDSRVSLDHAALALAGGALPLVDDELGRLQSHGDNSEVYHYLVAAFAYQQGDSVRARFESSEAVSHNADLLAARINWVRLLMKDRYSVVAREILNETPLLQRRRPSVVLQRAWLLAAAGETLAADRLLHVSSLSLPVSMDALRAPGAGTGVEALRAPFQENLRFDLLEYPQGPVFQETDMQLLEFYPNHEASARWLTF